MTAASPGQTPNVDGSTAEGFDRIWRHHGEGQPGDDAESEEFEIYFSTLPLAPFASAEGFELGSGNGRIARCVAPRVGLLNCVEPSPAGLAASRGTMSQLGNVRFHQATVDTIPLADSSQDFGYSIGVLHHIPDPQAGLKCCVAKLKRGAPFLLYVYYSLDNRPAWYRGIWRASDVARRGISRLPFRLRVAASTLLAATTYWPLSRTARLLDRLGLPVEHVPLAFYRDRDWSYLRDDALDRFGTRVEHRFSRIEVERMMLAAGLKDIRFADGPPFWIAVGCKA